MNYGLVLGSYFDAHCGSCKTLTVDLSILFVFLYACLANGADMVSGSGAILASFNSIHCRRPLILLPKCFIQ